VTEAGPVEIVVAALGVGVRAGDRD